MSSNITTIGGDDIILRHLEGWAKALSIDTILKNLLKKDIYSDPEKREGSLLEYYFTRTLDKKTKQKILLRINLRLAGQKKYSTIEKNQAESQGVTLDEILDRLIKTGATKTKP